jgi:mono/diheme cytochrome c family protein
MRLRIPCLTAILLFAFSTSLTAQTPTSQASKPEIKSAPASYTDPSSGRQMFDAYCASCHGQGGIGNGPAAPALKTPPTDLTKLAAMNGGKFPELQVSQSIKGDTTTTAHGSKEMPVWGPVFLYLGHHDPSVMQLRVRNLTKYVESLQQK